MTFSAQAPALQRPLRGDAKLALGPASIAAFLAIAAPVRADVLTLTAVRDATLFNDPAGATANGSGPVMVVGRAGGASTAPVRRSLVRFEVAAAIPAGAVVNSAELVLAHSSGNAGARTVEVRRVLADWGEGASSTTSGQGAPAQPGDATWLHTFFDTQLWNAAGGDFAPAVSSQQVVDALGVYSWPSTPLAVADVQAWLDHPATNFGWLLKLDVETVAQTTKVFGTREASDPAEHPRLVIEFDPPDVFSYCTSRVAGPGCVPSIGWSGAPSASAGAGFVVTLDQAVSRKSGVLVYGLSGPAAQPFLGGTLCVAPPLRRTPILWSGGSASGDDCSGAFAYDFNARIAAGSDPGLTAGALVHAQWRSRDPGNPAASFNTSDALRFLIAP